jgi:protein-tyrosine phosphatase
MPIKAILFVCLGNICRSPTAEAVFRHKAWQAALALEFDSAGTLGYHQGHSPDPRAVVAGRRRGFSFDGIVARQVLAADFERFDLILAADRQNLKELQALCPPAHRHKLRLILSFGAADTDEVPDPYYGGDEGFERVLDLLELGADGLMAYLSRETQDSQP